MTTSRCWVGEIPRCSVPPLMALAAKVRSEPTMSSAAIRTYGSGLTEADIGLGNRGPKPPSAIGAIAAG